MWWLPRRVRPVAKAPASDPPPGARHYGPATRRPGAATGEVPSVRSRLPVPTRTRSRRRRAPLHSVAWRSLMAWTSRGHSTQRLNHASTGPGQPSHGHSVLS
jgi:hypothetical protein